MKNLILLFNLFSVLHYSMGQSPTNHKGANDLKRLNFKGKVKNALGKHIYYDEDLNESEVNEFYYEFNEKGSITLETKYSFEGNLQSTKYYSYDSLNYLMEVREYDENNALSEWNTWKYDNKGNKIEEGQYYSYDSRYVNKRLDCRQIGDLVTNVVSYLGECIAEEIFYDPSGEILSTKKKEFDLNGNIIQDLDYIRDSINSKLILKGKKVRLFNDKNLPKQEIAYTVSRYTGNDLAISKINWNYLFVDNIKDSLLAEVIQTVYGKDGNEQSVYTSHKISYDSSGRRIEQSEYTENGNLSSITMWAYSSNGKIIATEKSEFYISDSCFHIEKENMQTGTTEKLVQNTEGRLIRGSIEYYKAGGLIVKDSVFNVVERRSSVTIYDYYKDKQLEKAHCYVYDDSGKLKSHSIIFQTIIDQSGKVLAEISYGRDSQVIMKKIFKYNAQGALTDMVNEKYGLVSSYEKYGANRNLIERGYYDSKGIINEKKIKKYHTKDIVSEELTYGYNNLLKSLNRFNLYGNQTEYARYNDDGSISRREVKKYYAKDKLSEKTDYSSDGSYRCVKFDQVGNEVEKGNYSSDGFVKDKRVSKYYSNGKRSEKIEYKEDGSYRVARYDILGNTTELSSYKSGGVIRYKYLYTYNASGIKTQTVHYWSNGVISYIIKYDLTGKEIQNIGYKKDGSLRNVFTYKYVYDSRGNWTERNSYYSKVLGSIGEFHKVEATQLIEYYP